MRGPLYAPWFCLKSMKPRPRLLTLPAHVSGLRKGAVLQHPGHGRAFKGLGVAKRYCRRDSICDTFVKWGFQRTWYSPIDRCDSPM